MSSKHYDYGSGAEASLLRARQLMVDAKWELEHGCTVECNRRIAAAIAELELLLRKAKEDTDA